MKKEERKLSFEDADYQLSMRVDPLTTTDEMQRELEALKESLKVKEEEAKAEAKAKAENDIILKQLKDAQDKPLKTADNEDDVS